MSALESRSSPVFMQCAEDLVARMQKIGTAEATLIAREAQELVDTFKCWFAERPPDELRVATIRRMLDLHRRAMDYLAAHPTLAHVQPSRPAPAGDEDDDDQHAPRPLPLRMPSR